jgi:hypothetical protein
MSLHSLPNAGQRYELNRKQTSKNAFLTYEEEFSCQQVCIEGIELPHRPVFTVAKPLYQALFFLNPELKHLLF